MKKKKNDSQKQSKSNNKPEFVRLKEIWKKENANGIEELEKNLPHVADEQTGIGSMPNPEVVTSKTTLEKARIMGVRKKNK